jgi:UDP-glucose 4-epimerase
MKKVLVLGSNGFLGRNLAICLASQRIEVIAMVDSRFDYSVLKNKSDIFCLEFDLSELEKFDSHPSIVGVDTIFHMAWAGVSTTHKNEARVQAQNILHGLSVLEFAERNHIKKVVVPGSAAEYSCGDGIINGKNLPSPSDLYSASKIATRFLCQTYAQQHDIDFIWTTITSVYGPGRNDNNLITYTIKSLLNKERPSFTGLEQEWDYIYIDDLISALIAIGQKGKGGKIYPIGSGVHRKMLEYVQLIKNQINPDLPIGIGDVPYKNAKIDNQVMDISELIEDTGYRPVFDFEDGIAITIDYFKSLMK